MKSTRGERGTAEKPLTLVVHDGEKLSRSTGVVENPQGWYVKPAHQFTLSSRKTVIMADQHQSDRAKQIKAELEVYKKFDQLEGRRKRAFEHAVQVKQDYYDDLRRKLIAETAPAFVETLVREKNADHLAFLEREEARAKKAAEEALKAAARQPALPGTELGEEVTDSDLVSE